MTLPFSRSYWAVPGQVLAGCYPGDRDSDVAETKLNGLLECGVTRVINLMEAHEVSHGGQAFVAYQPHLEGLAKKLGRTVKCERFPIVDRSVPSITGMIRILACIDEALSGREIVYVHCWGGRGRTGTVVACHLRRAQGLAADAALSAVTELTRHQAKAFWPTPEMPAQREFVHAWKEPQ